MKTRLISIAFVLIMFLFPNFISSCSKEDKQCLNCSALCGGEFSELDYCGDDLQSQEDAFRASHEGCDVTCTIN